MELASLSFESQKALVEELVATRNTYDFFFLLDILLSHSLENKKHFFLREGYIDFLRLLLIQLVKCLDSSSFKQSLQEYTPHQEVVQIFQHLEFMVRVYDSFNKTNYNKYFPINSLIGVFESIYLEQFEDIESQINMAKEVQKLNQNNILVINWFYSKFSNMLILSTPSALLQTHLIRNTSNYFEQIIDFLVQNINKWHRPSNRFFGYSTNFINKKYSFPKSVANIISILISNEHESNDTIINSFKIKAIALRELGKKDNEIDSTERKLYELIAPYSIRLEQFDQELKLSLSI
ncbi:hypothetical protein [Fluoribacter gormanii]|uniref:hypothetical protein n=1 Tax=Fluoribacter gormanii TaxID=464 RepID=UPI001041989A|nr:hypothetical protein [Fluoribacter gormanii]